MAAGALHYLEGQKLLYPAGHFFVLSAEDGKVCDYFETEWKWMKWIQSAAHFFGLSDAARMLVMFHSCPPCCPAPTLQQTSFVATATNSRAVLHLQLSANRRYLAAAELPLGGDQQQVSVYNIPAEKRERTLSLGPHTRSSCITSLSFRWG